MSKDILTLLADSQDGVYGVDLEHRIVLWNDRAQHLLGWTGEEVLGKRCYEVVGGHSERPDQCAPNCPAIMQARQSQIPSGQTIYTQAKDGAGKWLYVAHVLVPSEHPDLTVLVHILRDATNEVEARRLLQRLTQFLGQTSPSATPGESAPPLEQSLVGELSSREKEVLRLLARGYGTETIATSLYISPTTVRNHIQRILSKLDVHTRVEAVAYAFRHGLL